MDLIVLKENREQYEPTDEQITSYGEFLGLKFPQDDKFKILCYQALTAPLPPDWEACETREDRNMVFRNKITKQVQEQHPLDAYYMEKIAKLKSLTKNLPIQTILQQRESWLKQSSELFGPSKNSAEYSLKDQQFINEISEEKSVYDQETSQKDQQINQSKNIVIKKTIKTPRTYHRRKKQIPKAEVVKQRLLNYSFTPNFTTRQIKQHKYPNLQTAQEKDRLKSIVKLNENIQNKRKELKNLERERRRKLEHLQMLRSQMKVMEN